MVYITSFLICQFMVSNVFCKLGVEILSSLSFCHLPVSCTFRAWWRPLVDCERMCRFPSTCELYPLLPVQCTIWWSWWCWKQGVELTVKGCHLSWYNLCQHPEVNSWKGKIKSATFLYCQLSRLDCRHSCHLPHLLTFLGDRSRTRTMLIDQPALNILPAPLRTTTRHSGSLLNLDD